MKKILLILSVFISLQFAHAKTNDLFISQDLAEEATRLAALLNREDFSTKHCTLLEEIYEKIFNLSPSYFDIDSLITKVLPTINTLFQSRLTLKNKIAEFYDRGDIKAGAEEQACIRASRAAFRAMRYIEEYLTELYIKDNPTPLPSYLSGEFPFLKLNSNVKEQLIDPDTGKFKFKSGDIILSRGNRYASAAIARMGISDTQFSHNTLVYVDPDTNIVYTIEAHIEIGVDVKPIEEGHFKEGNTRAVVFRYKGDPRLPETAAKLMFERASKRKTNIPYDFSFNSQDSSELNCTEVISYAYKEAAKILGISMHTIPIFPTKLPINNMPDFFHKLAINEKIVYIPADLELEPRFELLAEWTDYKKLRAIIYKDAVMTKMFEWMDVEHLNYTINSELYMQVLAPILWLGRKLPVISDMSNLTHKFPSNMPISVLKLIPTLENIADTLESHLKSTEDKRYSLSPNALPLTPSQLYNILEKYREKDYKRLHECKKTDFHWLFHPEGEYWSKLCKKINTLK